ncbi:MAG: 3-phosphoshikimate 1-carboxyvinyltransferase [Lewinellaceae bacterium]|nr:3-phosphoshikimate 1-carboxyvinyltransferase [Phaeodactylibacter sp.]MCB0612122.1 3-phosphoshikimate 1-carboxyvinyltransferase [Phaeodactylibacter sp.]MCB9350104.1 3-phosphoshikimate 1-carboxyvinyltransferase [Lewinellaceae bacterium]
MSYTLNYRGRRLTGEITLAGSKSISNRALIIRALSGTDFPIHRLANARDTALLLQLLQSNGEIRDAGAAGTTFRFMTAFLSGQPGVQLLTGTERMKQRPIGILVDALRRLGADISYLEKEGYPPLRIGAPLNFGQNSRLSIAAGTSSQYISALLLIAPTLPGGLSLQLEGKIVSRPYIEMTLGLMQYFGVYHSWKGDTVHIPSQPYQPRPFQVEADWSGASYFYAMAALADEAHLQLNGLFEKSIQGDAVLAEMMQVFGIETTFNETGILLNKTAPVLPASFDWDFILCPDLAQTLAVVCGGLGVQGRFTGLDTLRIKETDRIAALQAELAKVHCRLEALPPEGAPQTGRQYFQTEGKASVEGTPAFATYEDHRMAMAFAPLAMLGPIRVEDPMVVVKSYPNFWEDLKQIGFEVSEA